VTLPVIMPQIGQDIPTGRIVQWLVREGEAVSKGDVIVTVESDKAVFEVEAEASGTMLEILCRDGEEAAVFSPIAYLGAPGEKVTEERIVASPAARRTARERGIVLGSVAGSGPSGRIILRDLPSPAAPSDEIERPFSPLRRRVAERLQLSKRNIPHFYLFSDVDITVTLAWREEFNSRNSCRLTVTDLLVRAVAKTLREMPELNVHVSDSGVTPKGRVNIGVAVTTEQGLMVPVIADADRKTIVEISREISESAEAARRGAMKVQAEGTFTISNLGMYEVDRFLPIINPPECAILGIGRGTPRLVVREEGFQVRTILTLCLACDHRAVDGAEGARFLSRLKELLEISDFGLRIAD
jgi:pyruvate dehydrogenase E2 component (dihydrolipoamide acetyltransferase)